MPCALLVQESLCHSQIVLMFQKGLTGLVANGANANCGAVRTYFVGLAFCLANSISCSYFRRLRVGQRLLGGGATS